MKFYYLKKKNFIAAYILRTLEMQMDTKEVFKDFKIKNLGDSHDTYLKTNTLILTDVFQFFRKMI